MACYHVATLGNPTLLYMPRFPKTEITFVNSPWRTLPLLYCELTSLPPMTKNKNKSALFCTHGISARTSTTLSVQCLLDRHGTEKYLLPNTETFEQVTQRDCIHHHSGLHQFHKLYTAVASTVNNLTIQEISVLERRWIIFPTHSESVGHISNVPTLFHLLNRIVIWGPLKYHFPTRFLFFLSLNI